MRLHPDRPHPRPPAAMRDAEGLVQVQMADVRPEVPRPRQPDQRVHVRPVEIDLPAVRVRDLADLPHRLLEHPVRRRIGHHARRQARPVLLRLRPEVLEVHVPVRRRRHRHHLHPRHLRARRVGPVRRGRDQAHVPLPLARGWRATPGSPAARHTPPAPRSSAASRRRRTRSPRRACRRDRRSPPDIPPSGPTARTDGCPRTPASSAPSSPPWRSASWCRTRAGSSPGRAPGPGPPAAACSG